MFSRADADELIARYNEHSPFFVVYGVATDYCVKKAVERACFVWVAAYWLVVDTIRPIDRSTEPGILTDFAPPGHDAHGDPGRLCRLSVMIGPTIAGASFLRERKTL